MIHTRPVVSTRQLVPAMRHQGYHITYAIAELIDNSIQAKSKNIEILCMDELNVDTNTKQLKSIAIHDDGTGMSKNELWDSIRLGESQSRGKGGIGRFGVGLTHASFSQCMRVDVYSWKKPDEIFHVYLDLDSLGDMDTVVVEEPTLSKIPNSWKKVSKHMSRSGTLVVWSKLDKVRWKKAKTLITHSEFTLGRIYRKFIDQNENTLQIYMISFDGNAGTPEINSTLLPNDPLYLIAPSLTPKPWDTTPMFQKDGEKWEETTQIEDQNGTKHEVITRYSFIKSEVRSGKRNPGSENFGKHAANNLGVSVIRAKREITLDTNMIISYDPKERWWGAEIEFPPALDEIFGVSSNKQSASELAHVMQLVGKQNREDRQKEDLAGEEDNPLFDLVQRMSERISALRDSIDRQRPKPPQSGSGPESGGPPRVPIDNEPSVTKDQNDTMTENEKRKAFEELMNRLGIKDVKWSADEELRFEHIPMTGSQFFDISFTGGEMIIQINTDHKAYKYLLGLLLDQEHRDKISSDKLLQKSTEGFQKFLASWASLENKTMNRSDRKNLADIRYQWGKILEKYFEVNED